MSMYLAVTNVVPQKEYKLHLTFENGEHKIFDMSPYLDLEIFNALKDEKLFKTVKVSFDTIEWDNEADFDPEVLYDQGVSV